MALLGPIGDRRLPGVLEMETRKNRTIIILHRMDKASLDSCKALSPAAENARSPNSSHRAKSASMVGSVMAYIAGVMRDSDSTVTISLLKEIEPSQSPCILLPESRLHRSIMNSAAPSPWCEFAALKLSKASRNSPE